MAKRPKVTTWEQAEELLSEMYVPGTRITGLWSSGGVFTFAVRRPGHDFRLEQIGPRGGHSAFLHLNPEQEEILRDHLTGGSFG